MIGCTCSCCQATRKFEQKVALGLLIAAAIFALGLLTTGCGGKVVIPPCILDGTCLPKPDPTPTPTPPPPPPPPPPVTPPTTLPPVVPPTPQGDPFTNDPLPPLSSIQTVEENQFLLPNPDFTASVNSAINLACGPCEDQPKDWIGYLRTFQERMNALGFSVNYDWDHGNPWTGSDGVKHDTGFASEFTIWRGGRAEFYQILTSAGKVRRPNGAFRGTAVAGCPLDPTQTLRIKAPLRSGEAGARWLDITYEYFYGENGPCGRRFCDLGDDGGPNGNVCADQLGGVPTFISNGQGLQLITPFRDNRNKAQVFGSGTVKACSSVQPEVCVETVIP